MRFGVVAAFLGALSSSCSMLPTRGPGGGRCVDSSDCGSGMTCDLGTQWCVCAGPNCPDGGAGHGGGAAAGHGGAAGMGTGGTAGASGAAGGASGTGGAVDAGQDVNPCNACGGATPVCSNRSCVECATSSDCTAAAAKPICDLTSNTCVACKTDAQCSSKLGATGNPGVCRSETDGHCATDAETIYVQNVTGCTTTFMTTSGGTATAPYCSMEPVNLAAGGAKTLVVIRGTVAATSSGWTWQRAAGTPATTFVGQQSAVIAIATNPGFSMESGTVYFRNLKFGPSPSGTVCIQATGGTLSLASVLVDTCQGGGIYLDGAAFDIENSTITNNGPASRGAVQWGGLLINSAPPSGRTTLNLVTIQNNKQVGLDCAVPVQGTGILATGNGVDIATSCDVTGCSGAGTNCGAQ